MAYDNCRRHFRQQVSSPTTIALRYCDLIQAILIFKRNNTIEDPEFKQALSDLNPDVIYEKLKVICKRNPKKKFRKLPSHQVSIISNDNLLSLDVNSSCFENLESVKQNGGIQVRQNYQLIFFMIMINLCGRFHCSLWIIKWIIIRKHAEIHLIRDPQTGSSI